MAKPKRAKLVRPATTANKSTVSITKFKPLQRFALFFFDRPRFTAIVALGVFLFGLLSYTTLLTREGFPSINIPVAVVNGTYIVNDAEKVDAEVAKPISDLALEQDGVQTVQAQSGANFFSVAVQYTEQTDAQAAAKQLEQQVKDKANLPETALVQFNVPYFGVTGGDTKKIDLTISYFQSSDASSTKQLVSGAEQAAAYLNDNKPSLVKEFFVQDPFKTATNPLTGQAAVVQQSFDRFGKRIDDKNIFHNSIIIAATATNSADVIKLDKQVRETLDDLKQQPFMQGYQAEISASYAPTIQDEIGELQRVLIEGLLAVLLVGSIVIAVRAAFITVISMVTVITITAGVLFLVGYSLNVITLFALILGLSLIVDDTIIMVEALDVARKRNRHARDAVSQATGKISKAMVAATTTAALSFAPLIFVSGILGTFIRAIPVTIISALFISLLVALVVIPFLARYILLGKNQMGEKGVKELAAGVEHKIAEFIATPMLWAQHSRAKIALVGTGALFVGIGFIVAAGFIGKNVTFNIFPPTKDTNGVTLTMNFPPNTTIEQAEATADNVDETAAKVIGPNFVKASYYNSGTETGARMVVDLISYNDRKVTSPQIVEQLDAAFADFEGASVTAGQIDAGPPASGFVVQINTENRAAAYKLAQDVANFLETTTLTRPNGSTAQFTDVTISNQSQIVRADGSQVVQIEAGFNADDTSTLVTLAENAVKDEFPAEKVASYGVDSDALGFNLGQESENQDSFKTLAIAFPILLAVIYVLLAFEFRSLLQPLLIFLAIPFSLFGVMLGLDLTDNPISFFSMLGFFALIGLSIKNTILLTDYANQSRRAGMNPVQAAHEALAERFRPLIATSLTAVVSLIPLALTSPFWQGLAVVLIFGLLSSTFLVVTVFPYYYLGAELLRGVWRRQVGSRIRRAFHAVVK